MFFWVNGEVVLLHYKTTIIIMKKMITTTLIVITLLAGAGFIYLDPYNVLYAQHWKFKYPSTPVLPWVHFLWDGTTVGGKHHEKAAMIFPVKIDNIAANFYCQFDLGAIYTMLYGNTLSAYMNNSASLSNKQGKRLWHKCLNNITIQIDSLSLQGDRVQVFKNYGDSISRDSLFSDEPKMIGTIGVDVCQDKVVIIDYPNQRICFVDSLPVSYKATYDMKVSSSGRPFLRMKHNGKEYWLFYDTGSSLFPLWVSKSMVADFSPYPITDTIVGSTWGDYMTVYGRPVKDTITVGGKSFSNFEMYNNNLFASKIVTSCAINALGFGGLTGNALFYNSIVILDFKNKKFGVM